MAKSSALSDFPEIPAAGTTAWFDHDGGDVSLQAREVLGRAKGEWQRLSTLEVSARAKFVATSIVLLLLSTLSAALGAAPGVAPWLRAGVAALVTAGIAFVGIFRFAHVWDIKRHAATDLSFEAFAFLNRVGPYAEGTTKEATQTFYDRMKEIRVTSESEHDAKG